MLGIVLFVVGGVVVNVPWCPLSLMLDNLTKMVLVPPALVHNTQVDIFWHNISSMPLIVNVVLVVA